MGTRLGVRAPCGQRVRAPRVKNGLISCSWLHLLKVWSLLKIRGDSEDTGTGKSFAGLVGFDLSILSLTKLPIVLHDSVIYKNIEVEATARILRILAAMRSKQIFLSFDEAKKFGPDVEELIKRFTVLKLAHDDLLYNKDWRARAEQ